MSQCTAKAKRTGKQCRANAIKGKDKCRVHGGMTPIKHGMRSKYKGEVLGDRIQALIDDPDLANMRLQLATLVALAESVLARVEAANEVDESNHSAIMTLAIELTKAIERYHKITEGTKHTIRIEQIQSVVYQIVQVADETIRDVSDRRRFVERLGQLSLPGPPSSN
jgi:hypothetical protein